MGPHTTRLCADRTEKESLPRPFEVKRGRLNIVRHLGVPLKSRSAAYEHSPWHHSAKSSPARRLCQEYPTPKVQRGRIRWTSVMTALLYTTKLTSGVSLGDSCG